MPEQQSPIQSQNETAAKTATPEKPRVKYDRETFQNTAKQVNGIRDKIKSANTLDEIAPLAQKGKILEANMRDMYAVAQDEAEAENKTFDENKAKEQDQRTLEMAKSGTLSFDELVDATKGKGKPESETTSKAEGDPSNQAEADKTATKENQERAKEQAIDDAIEKEAQSVEVNARAASKAVEEAGGEDAIKKTLEEIPDDGKEALKQKLVKEHEKIMADRKLDLDNSIDLVKFSGEAIINPFLLARMGTGDDDLVEKGLTGTVGVMLWALGQQQLFGLGLGVKESFSAIKQKIGMMRENRRHRRELKRLDTHT